MKNMTNYFFVLTVLSFFFSGCTKMFEDEDFTLKKESYTGKEIRIDGYYYRHYDISEDVNILIFYQNGVMLDGGAGHSLNEFEEKFRSRSYENNIKQCWGLFIIDSNVVKVENIIGMGWLHAYAYTDFGEIVNDSTIHFYEHKESYTDVYTPMDDTYHFKQFSPKPDSTNIWIK